MYLMQMKGYQKTLASFFIIFLFSSLTVRSEIAPNLLELTEGTAIIGDMYQSDMYGRNNFTVDRIWHDSFFDIDFVEFSMEIIFDPPYDPDLHVVRESITSLIVKNNRTQIVIALHFIETLEYNITVFFDYTDDLNMTEDDLKVNFNGTTYIYDEIDPGMLYYDVISYWVLSFFLGNMLWQGMFPFIKYAISPQATIGEEIQYGPYNGSVVGFKDYFISETEYFEAIEVHHNETIVLVNILGTDSPFTVGETTLLYEKNTGIILHWY